MVDTKKYISKNKKQKSFQIINEKDIAHKLLFKKGGNLFNEIKKMISNNSNNNNKIYFIKASESQKYVEKHKQNKNKNISNKNKKIPNKNKKISNKNKKI